MHLVYSSPAVREAFIEWYNTGTNKDIMGNELEPEANPDIRAIIDFYNSEIAHEQVISVEED